MNKEELWEALKKDHTKFGDYRDWNDVIQKMESIVGLDVEAEMMAALIQEIKND